MTAALPRYAAHPSWLRYRELLARRFDLELVHAPREREQLVCGQRLHVDDWQPSGAPRGTLILVHGGGGHGRLLAPLADWAVTAGWRALAPDLPGYGLSPAGPGWDWDYDAWPACVAALADEAAAERQGPVALLGASIGGLTAVRAAQRAQAAIAGVAATTLIDLRDDATLIASARWRWLGRLSLALMRRAPRLLARLPMPLGLATPIGTLTRDPELRRYFETDPLLGRKWVPGRWFASLHAHVPTRADYALPCPLLLVHPGADAWTPTAMSLPIYAAVPGPKRMVELSNGSHLPLERPARDELRAELERWLNELRDR